MDGQPRSIKWRARTLARGRHPTHGDRLMIEYHRWYPQYNFAEHKGYSTPEHLRLLREHGPCAIHRCTYAPVQHLLADNMTEFDSDFDYT